MTSRIGRLRRPGPDDLEEEEKEEVRVGTRPIIGAVNMISDVEEAIEQLNSWAGSRHCS